MMPVAALIAMLATVQSAPPATQPDLLAGPTVAPAETQPTLVRRSFDGTLEDIGAEPDRAAIEMLHLNDEQQAAFDRIVEERTSLFDQTVRNNYGLILELASLQGSNDSAKAIDIIGKTRKAFSEFIERGSFFEEMSPHLGDEQRAQAGAMVAEWQRAKFESLRQQLGKDARPPQVRSRARLEAFGQMIRESIERQVGLEQDLFEHFATELDLTAEQRNQAQAIFQPLAIKRFQNIKVTAAENAKAYAAFNKVLTPAQRQKLLKLMVQQWREQRDAVPATLAPGSTQSPDSPATQPLDHNMDQ